MPAEDLPPTNDLSTLQATQAKLKAKLESLNGRLEGLENGAAVLIEAIAETRKAIAEAVALRLKVTFQLLLPN